MYVWQLGAELSIASAALSGFIEIYSEFQLIV